MAIFKSYPAAHAHPAVASCGRACELQRSVSRISNSDSLDVQLIGLRAFAHILSNSPVVWSDTKIPLYQQLLLASRRLDGRMNGEAQATANFVHETAKKDGSLNPSQKAHICSFFNKLDEKEEIIRS